MNEGIATLSTYRSPLGKISYRVAALDDDSKVIGIDENKGVWEAFRMGELRTLRKFDTVGDAIDWAINRVGALSTAPEDTSGYRRPTNTKPSTRPY